MKVLNKNILTMAVATVVTGAAVSLLGSSSIEANTTAENMDANGYPIAPPSPFSTKAEVGRASTDKHANTEASTSTPAVAETGATTPNATVTADTVANDTSHPSETGNVAVDKAEASTVVATKPALETSNDSSSKAKIAATEKKSLMDEIVADEAMATKIPSMPNKPTAPVPPMQMESMSGKAPQQMQAVVEKPVMPDHVVVAFPHPDPAMDTVPDAPNNNTANAPVAPSMPTPPATIEAPKAGVAPAMPILSSTHDEPVKSKLATPRSTDKPAVLAMPQMPTMPQMPVMQMPVMAPNMQMQTHRPVMSIPAPIQMEMPPQLPLSMPQQMIAPQFSMSQTGTPTQQPMPVMPVAPDSQANEVK